MAGQVMLVPHFNPRCHSGIPVLLIEGILFFTVCRRNAADVKLARQQIARVIYGLNLPFNAVDNCQLKTLIRMGFPGT